jgi:D-alanyl-D-alanine-carboxypeptidase/D-alanyl-D-alanine-endopeptidase
MLSRNIIARIALFLLSAAALNFRAGSATAQDRLLQETVEFTGAVLFLEHKVPGLVIGAIRGPERAVAGFGETKKATGTRPDERTVFRIGSVTKAFTGEVLAALVAENTIKLTDPLQKHLGWDVAVPSRDEKVVRLVDLATHAGGFPREVPHEAGPPDDPFATITKEAFKVSLARDKLLFAPGTGALYSNMGFDLLAAALAGASGKAYPDLLRERITAPRGMSDTGFSLNAEQKTRLMQGHDFDGKPLPDVPTGSTIVGSGGLYSSVADILTWLRWHLDQFSTDGTEVRLIDHATWLARDGLAPVYGFDESGKIDGMALAWVVMMPQSNRPFILQKAGGLQGVFCYAAFAPTRGVGAFIAINQFNFGAAMAMATAVNDMIGAIAPR